MCFGCGSKNCKWWAKGQIVCPHANRPNAKKYAEENYKKFNPKNRHRFDGGTRTPKWDKLNLRSKRSLTCSLHQNPEAMREFEIHLAARKREANEREEDAAYQEFKRAAKSTCMPAIPIFNTIAGNPPPIPV